jgi:hypothetical protein
MGNAVGRKLDKLLGNKGTKYIEDNYSISNGNYISNSTRNSQKLTGYSTSELCSMNEYMRPSYNSNASGLYSVNEHVGTLYNSNASGLYPINKHVGTLYNSNASGLYPVNEYTGQVYAPMMNYIVPQLQRTISVNIANKIKIIMCKICKKNKSTVALFCPCKFRTCMTCYHKLHEKHPIVLCPACKIPTNDLILCPLAHA